ncbi:MAG: primosomal protein N' [Selenomonadales bacterium]|nr:primosomal protein N' [Selenomonadales bacterium]
MIVDVFVNVPVKKLDKPFTYRVPSKFSHVNIGWRVLVPFGGRMVEGFVVECHDESTAARDIELKDIADVLDEEAWFSRDMMAMAKWVSEYYLCTLAEAMRLFIPGKGGVRISYQYQSKECENITLTENEEAVYRCLNEHGTQSITALKKTFPEWNMESILSRLIKKDCIEKHFCTQKKMKEKWETVYELITNEQIPTIRMTEKRRAVLSTLKDRKALRASELNQFGITKDVLDRLVQLGLVSIHRERISRDSFRDVASNMNAICLNEDQILAMKRIKEALMQDAYKPFLLYGITGSGKTEIYIESAQHARARGKQVIVLVPEIALTSQIVSRFRTYFGNDVVVIHSKLSLAERGDALWRLRTGAAGIVIGARSALFSTMPDLGLIILDEEHDSSYKQDEAPHYHAKDTALAFGEITNSVVILGSATPSIESFYLAQEGVYELLSLPKRKNGSVLPSIELVDMRKELRRGKKNVISQRLHGLLTDTLQKQQQAILLLNRRGYATFINCRSCGHVMMCPQCSASLVYHASGKLQCHYCEKIVSVPSVCPNCESRYIRYFGSGTQKLQEEMRTSFPTARIARLDRDTTAGKMSYHQILEDFAAHKQDILLGTQMVAKGHDIAGVTAVGVITADSMLNIPDFRSAERTFALLTQTAGRAGRGNEKGNVVIQTYTPEHYAIQAGAKQDYEAFYKEETAYRKEAFYPPYCRLIKLTFLDTIKEKAVARATDVVDELEKRLAEPKGTEILGPFGAAVEKIREYYRINILIKTTDPQAVKDTLRTMNLHHTDNLILDIDPTNTM